MTDKKFVLLWMKWVTIFGNKDLVRTTILIIREDRNSQVHNFSCIFHKSHIYFLTKIVSVKLSYCKIMWHWMHTEQYKMIYQGSVLTFLTQYSEEDDDFLHHKLLGMRHECCMKFLNWSSSWWNGDFSLSTKIKFKIMFSTWKIMIFNRQLVWLVNCMLQGSTSFNIDISWETRNCIVWSRISNITSLHGVDSWQWLTHFCCNTAPHYRLWLGTIQSFFLQSRSHIKQLSCVPACEIHPCWLTAVT